MYNALQLRWLMCIEALYVLLCSFFPHEILKHMKWYVGKSIVFDANNNFRDKSFYLNYGVSCLEMVMDYNSLQCREGIQYPYIDTKDRMIASNTKLQYNQDETCVRIL